MSLPDRSVGEGDTAGAERVDRMSRKLQPIHRSERRHASVGRVGAVTANTVGSAGHHPRESAHRLVALQPTLPVHEAGTPTRRSQSVSPRMKDGTTRLKPLTSTETVSMHHRRYISEGLHDAPVAHHTNDSHTVSEFPSVSSNFSASEQSAGALRKPRFSEATVSWMEKTVVKYDPPAMIEDEQPDVDKHLLALKASKMSTEELFAELGALRAAGYARKKPADHIEHKGPGETRFAEVESVYGSLSPVGSGARRKARRAVQASSQGPASSIGSASDGASGSSESFPLEPDVCSPAWFAQVLGPRNGVTLRNSPSKLLTKPTKPSASKAMRHGGSPLAHRTVVRAPSWRDHASPPSSSSPAEIAASLAGSHGLRSGDVDMAIQLLKGRMATMDAARGLPSPLAGQAPVDALTQHKQLAESFYARLLSQHEVAMPVTANVDPDDSGHNSEAAATPSTSAHPTRNKPATDMSQVATQLPQPQGSTAEKNTSRGAERVQSSWAFSDEDVTPESLEKALEGSDDEHSSPTRVQSSWLFSDKDVDGSPEQSVAVPSPGDSDEDVTAVTVDLEARTTNHATVPVNTATPGTVVKAPSSWLFSEDDVATGLAPTARADSAGLAASTSARASLDHGGSEVPHDAKQGHNGTGNASVAESTCAPTSHASTPIIVTTPASTTHASPDAVQAEGPAVVTMAPSSWAFSDDDVATGIVPTPRDEPKHMQVAGAGHAIGVLDTDVPDTWPDSEDEIAASPHSSHQEPRTTTVGPVAAKPAVSDVMPAADVDTKLAEVAFGSARQRDLYLSSRDIDLFCSQSPVPPECITIAAAVRSIPTIFMHLLGRSPYTSALELQVCILMGVKPSWKQCKEILQDRASDDFILHLKPSDFSKEVIHVARNVLSATFAQTKTQIELSSLKASKGAYSAVHVLEIFPPLRVYHALYCVQRFSTGY